MISVYHDTVGRGCTLELDYAIDRDGLVDARHAVVYKALGSWVRACYGIPLVSGSGQGYELVLAKPAGVFDRVVLQEEIMSGQRVWQWRVEVLISGSWELAANASSIGQKRIARFRATT